MTWWMYSCACIDCASQRETRRLCVLQIVNTGNSIGYDSICCTRCEECGDVEERFLIVFHLRTPWPLIIALRTSTQMSICHKFAAVYIILYYANYTPVYYEKPTFSSKMIKPLNISQTTNRFIKFYFFCHNAIFSQTPSYLITYLQGHWSSWTTLGRVTPTQSNILWQG